MEKYARLVTISDTVQIIAHMPNKVYILVLLNYHMHDPHVNCLMILVEYQKGAHPSRCDYS